jgi:hypothetical protein
MGRSEVSAPRSTPFRPAISNDASWVVTVQPAAFGGTRLAEGTPIQSRTPRESE